MSLKTNDEVDSLRIFVRFGKLKLVKQMGYGKDTFHAPPASKGCYAFPLKYQEFFLIGSLDTTQPDEFNKVKKLDGFKKQRSKIRHQFIVSKDVELWHHLNVDNKDVLGRHNSWVKTNYYAWKKAIIKDGLNLRMISSGGDINSVGKICGFYSKDHYEVFFDTKVF